MTIFVQLQKNSDPHTLKMVAFRNLRKLHKTQRKQALLKLTTYVQPWTFLNLLLDQKRHEDEDATTILQEVVKRRYPTATLLLRG